MRKSVLRKPGGFTLVELLVVIAIIGILVALLLPAIQAAREAGRRSQCSNNLKQLGLGLQNYHDINKKFPSGYGGNNTYSTAGTGRSWMYGILPFVEQKGLFDLVKWGAPIDAGNAALSDPSNTTVSLTVLQGWLCPSDGYNGGGKLGERANVNDVRAISNYKAVAGSNWAWGDHVHAPVTGKFPASNNGLDQGNGLICRNADGAVNTRAVNENVTFSSILDGSSNTFAIGECVPAFCTHSWWWWFNGSTATCGVPLNYRINQGVGFLRQQHGDWPRNYSFFALHPGGGQFCLADDSVRFVSNNIDLTAYRNLATISGSEPVELP
jgi:prepilin-type N-terminal cleavage/methylation domain-containing protein